MKPIGHGPQERYAEGTREPGECRLCKQPIWIVYHGPRANHTTEPRLATTFTADELQKLALMVNELVGQRLPRPYEEPILRKLQASIDRARDEIAAVEARP